MTSYNATLKDWVDDLCVRFIVNLPTEELSSIERICFQIEEAQWFYEDFVRPLDSTLPSINLKQFCMLIFQQCALFNSWDQELYSRAFSDFLTYKTRVPVRGAIMLNEAMDQCVLVKGWKKSANWSFPRGKINKGEADLACAIREVYEETGFDIQAAGLVPTEESQAKFIEITMREQHMKLFVFHGVPMDTHFQPRTRKEISSIQWYRLSDLPANKKNPKHQYNQQQDGLDDNLATNANKFYMVAPFMSHLKRYIASMRKRDAAKQQEGLQPAYTQDPSIVDLQETTQGLSIGGSMASAPSNDMDRLLNQLRQSEQAARETNYPEAISQPMSVPDQSAQLRSMLNVATTQHNNSAASSNLLHLLRQPIVSAPGSVPSGTPPIGLISGDLGISPALSVQQNLSRAPSHSPVPPQGTAPAASWSHGPGQGQRSQPGFQASIPQTPLEQVFGQPLMPASPKHHHRQHQAPADATAVPPPIFPYSPSHVRHESGGQPSTRPAIRMEMPAQAPWTETGAQREAPIARARSPAPYQQSEDPIFSNTDQIVASAPEPSRLPPPKLTANSAKLLSLFTAKVSGASVAAAEMSGDSASTAGPRTPDPHGVFGASPAPAHYSQVHHGQRSLAPPVPISTSNARSFSPALASPTEIGPSSPAASRPRTAQQSALLDLFKSQPTRSASGAGRASGTLSPALAPAPSAFLPSLPAELSNASSPALSGAANPDKRRSGSREALAPALTPGAKITIAKRPTGHTPLPSMSATVSGPLLVTEQDFSKASLGNSIIPGNVKILSRPGTSSGPVTGRKLEASPKTASPKPGRSPRRRPDTRQAKASPKPFAPQILKRPVERTSENAKELRVTPPAVPTQILRREPELPSPMSRQTSIGTGFEPVSAVTPAPVDGFDRRSSQSSDQKANLLSLFGKTTVQQPAISPLSSMPRTRMGSLASNGSGDPGRAASQTSDKDKKFLLGFLNNMVNESR